MLGVNKIIQFFDEAIDNPIDFSALIVKVKEFKTMNYDMIRRKYLKHALNVGHGRSFLF